ncbi:MAG: type II toxin-antitoxin system HicA family toxin [Rhodospirillales bacterium]
MRSCASGASRSRSRTCRSGVQVGECFFLRPPSLEGGGKGEGARRSRVAATPPTRNCDAAGALGRGDSINRRRTEPDKPDSRIRGSHYFLSRMVAGRRRDVVVPWHGGDLPKGTLKAILKQAGISP